MNFDCIVSQGHVDPGHDPQGNLTSAQKMEIVKLSIAHLRKWNPHSYIILTGHGVCPPDKTLDLCDWVYWEDEIRPMLPSGFVQGMPAQFVFVSKGMQHAVERGFHAVLKTRTDSVIGIPFITSWCNDILTIEEKDMLITQMSGNGFMGDCFLYGNTFIQNQLWHECNPVHHWDGLINTLKNYEVVCGGTWPQLAKETCAFRNVDELKFSCLRLNYHRLAEQGWDRVRGQIMDNEFDFAKYHWGNSWFSFDDEGNMTTTHAAEWDRRNFYA